MFWQREYLRENSAFVRGDTWREDLPKSGMLGSMLFRLSVAGVSGAFAETDKWRIVDFLSKIEVIADGSTVIKSLTGEVVSALSFFDQGVANVDYWHSYGTGTKWCHLLLNFGRYLKDTEFGLNLSRYKNVELRVTNDASSTYFGASLSLSVLCYYLRDATSGAFGGHFRTEEWRKWTTVQNETQYLELPQELAIRRIIMQVLADQDATNIAETGMWNVAYNVDLSLDTGVTRVFNGGIDDLMWENHWQYGKEVLSSPNLYMTADYGRRVGMGYVLGAVVGAGTQDGAVATAVPTIEGRRTDMTQKPENYEADTLQSLIVRGLAPEECVVFPFNFPDVPGSYLDPRGRGTVLMNVQTRDAASAADGTIRVMLDRLVR